MHLDGEAEDAVIGIKRGPEPEFIIPFALPGGQSKTGMTAFAIFERQDDALLVRRAGGRGKG
jgi:hypothetical protein